MSEALSTGPLATALGVALVGLLPLAFVALTSFVKISTVLTIARAAIAAEGVPSNVVVLALSLALTVVAMAPVGTILGERVAPVLDRAESAAPTLAADVVRAAKPPLASFLEKNASERELDRFEALSKSTSGNKRVVDRSDITVVLPAFLVTELIEAFALGFAIFLPFLVVDFVVANVLAALGLLSLAPNQVSLPFKLLLFVAADGWGLLAEALVSGYTMP